MAIVKDEHAEGFPLGFRAENTKCYNETATTICNGTRPGHTAGVIGFSRESENNQPMVYGISAYDSNAMKSPNPNSGVYKADTARTLDNNGGSPACNQGGMAVVAIATKQVSQNISDNTANPLCANDYKEPQVVCLNDQGGSVMSTSENETATLRAQTHGHEPVVCAGFSTEHSAKARSIGYEEEKAPTLRAGVVPATVFENHSQDTRYTPLGDICSTVSSTYGMGGNNQPFVVKEPVLLESNQNHATIQTNGVSTALPASMGMGGGYIPMIAEPVCIGNGQADQTKESELVGALNCMHDQQAVMTFSDIHSTLNAQDGRGGVHTQMMRAPEENFVCSYGLDRASYNQGKNAQFDFSVEKEKIAPQIAKGPGAVCAVDCRNGKESEINATLQADADHNTNSNNVCRIEASVRRLTPMECERLQGFPSGWTDIGEWIDSKGKKHKPADAPRYKALGNSIALPFWFWLLRRISATYTRQATLGSLFSGIGGFDICWELCNGAGTARWQSEIEEFPIAVCKRRFGDEATGERGDAWRYINP